MFMFHPNNRTRVGPGRVTVFTHARRIAKRNASKYPFPHQSKRERTRAARKLERLLG